MSATKVHEIIKKYRILHQKHIESWEEAQKRIRKFAVDGTVTIDENVYRFESYNYQVEGNNLFSAMVKELEGQEIFPNKNKYKKI